MTLLEVATEFGKLGGGIGAGIVALSAGLGIGRLAASAAESMARQPQMKDDVRGIAILTAAFIEGVALFGEVICLLLAI